MQPKFKLNLTGVQQNENHNNDMTNFEDRTYEQMVQTI